MHTRDKTRPRIWLLKLTVTVLNRWIKNNSMIHEFSVSSQCSKICVFILWKDFPLYFVQTLRSSDHRLCDNYLSDSGISHLLEALSGNHSLQRLSLMHTGLSDKSALLLAERLGQYDLLKELNVAYNNIGDSAALTLVDACREHPSIHTVQWVQQCFDLFLCIFRVNLISKCCFKCISQIYTVHCNIISRVFFLLGQ